MGVLLWVFKKYFLIKCFNNIKLVIFVLIWDYIMFVKIKYLIQKIYKI